MFWTRVYFIRASSKKRNDDSGIRLLTQYRTSSLLLRQRTARTLSGDSSSMDQLMTLGARDTSLLSFSLSPLRVCVCVHTRVC